MEKIATQKEIVETAKLLAFPIDFKSLEKENVVEKHGSWFKLLDPKNLPQHALTQVRAIKFDNKGNIYVKFPKSWKKAQQLYKRMTGKEYNE